MSNCISIILFYLTVYMTDRSHMDQLLIVILGLVTILLSFNLLIIREFTGFSICSIIWCKLQFDFSLSTNYRLYHYWTFSQGNEILLYHIFNKTIFCCEEPNSWVLSMGHLCNTFFTIASTYIKLILKCFKVTVKSKKKHDTYEMFNNYMNC